MKLELKKFLISTALFITYILWSFSNYETIPIPNLLKYTFYQIFGWPPYSLILFILAYIVFNITYFIVFLFLRKVFKSKFNLLRVTSIVLAIVLLLIVINKEYMYRNFIEYKLSRNNAEMEYFKKDEIGKVDDTNYDKYIWIKKYYDSSTPEIIRKETLKFESDSVALISGWMTKADNLFLIRNIFGLYENKYSLTYSKKRDTLFLKEGKANFKSYYEELRLIKIQNNKLFLKTILVDSVINVREIGE